MERVLLLIERAVSAIAAAALAFCAIYIGVAVIGLALRTAPPDEDLLVAEAMVIVAFLPHIVLVRRDLNVSVDLLVRHAPRALQRFCDALAALAGIAAYCLLGWAAWLAFDRVVAFESFYVSDLGLPEWPARAVVLLGVLGGLLACVEKFIRQLVAPQPGPDSPAGPVEKQESGTS